MEADWPKEGGRADDWTTVTMSVLKQTAWESGSDAMNNQLWLKITRKEGDSAVNW